MASEDDILARSMLSSKSYGGGSDIAPAPVSEVDVSDLRSRYDGLRGYDSREEYRGFKVPDGMSSDQREAWFASIDEREDAKDAGRVWGDPEPWESQIPRYIWDTAMELEREEKRFKEDPLGRGRAYKDWAEGVYEDVMSGDPETIRNVADVASLTDPTGASDLTSAGASARLAYDEPEKRKSHLTDVAISGVAGAIGFIPLVGTILPGSQAMKTAIKGAPEPVFESVAEKFAVGLPDKLGVQDLEGILGRKKHQKAGQVARYAQDVKDKDTGKIVHKKGDKKLTKSGEEIVYPEYVYKDITAGEWSDTKLDEFIETARSSGKKSVTKDELIKHLDENKVQVEEVRLSHASQEVPDDIKALAKQKGAAFDSLNDDAQSVASVLSSDVPLHSSSVSENMHRFSNNPSHFFRMYMDYVGRISDIDLFVDVPDDMVEIVKRLKNLSDNRSVSSWTPEDAALITEARKKINAKLEDPEYKNFVEGNRFVLDDEFGYDLEILTKTGLKHENLEDIGRILDEMPEAETRLAALREFQALPKYQEFAQASKEYKEKYSAFQTKTRSLAPRWEERSVPGGEDYQEILLTVPNRNQEIVDDLILKNEELQKEVDALDDAYEAGTMPDLEMSRASEIDIQIAANDIEIKKLLKKDLNLFTESHHSDIPNVMAHIRFKTRIDSRGRKIMFVEEIQSDWHQQGLKQGYRKQEKRFTVLEKDSGDEIASFDTKDEAEAFISKNDPQKERVRLIDLSEMTFPTNPIFGNPVPDAPFKDTKEWTALAIKRIFREAADKGYDGVVFSRADMITPVVTLPPHEAADIIRSVRPEEAFLARLAELKQQGGHYAQGAEEAEKVFKGNQYFYDKLIPSIVKKETKAKRSNTFIDLDPDGIVAKDHHEAEKMFPFFELTDKVKDRVIKPQKLYSLALPGIAVGAAAAEEEELSAVAALGAIGLGGMALYKGAKGARAAGRATRGFPVE